MANSLKLLKLKPRGFQFIQELSVAAPPAKVWAALLDMPNWFYIGAQERTTMKTTLEPHISGRFMSIANDGSVSMLNGVVARIEPQKLLRINGPMGMTHLPVSNVMIWELQPRDGGKATLLRFCQRTYGYMTQEVEKQYRGGWGELLPQLKALAEKSRGRGVRKTSRTRTKK